MLPTGDKKDNNSEICKDAQYDTRLSPAHDGYRDSRVAGTVTRRQLDIERSVSRSLLREFRRPWLVLVYSDNDVLISCCMPKAFQET